MTEDISRRGLMLVLSSPSGAGKTTISRKILERDPNISLSISVTTRPKRPAEEEGKDYFFIDKKAYEKMVERGELLEHAKVFDHYYGTPKAAVEQALSQGRDVLFDIDWQGTQQLEENAGEDLVSIFILPPSMAELEDRLRRRAQDSDDVVQSRMAKAADEMSHWNEYSYIIINRDIEDSVASVQSILRGERLKRHRQIGLAEFINSLRETD